MPRTRGGFPEGGESELGLSVGRRTTKARNPLDLEVAVLDFCKDDFEINEMVLSRHPEHSGAWWPGIVLDPRTEVPEQVRRLKQRDTSLCIMFYGSSPRARDFLWVTGNGDLLPLADYYPALKRIRDSKPGGDLFSAAIDEVAMIKRGEMDRVAGAVDDDMANGGRSHGRQQRVTECISCECALDNFEIANARQLHSRCQSCHEQYQKGHFCPECDRVWFPTDHDMVGCDSCSFWVHAACDRLAAKALASAEQMDFFCRQCRRVRNFNNRLAALQQAEHALRQSEPRQPRTAFGLFATEIQRQYNVDTRVQNLGRVVSDTWRSLTMEERMPYERAAAGDMARYQRDSRIFQEVQRRYTELRYAAEQDGIIDEEGQPIKITRIGGHKPTSPAGRPASLGRQNSFRGSGSSTPRSLPPQSTNTRPRQMKSPPKSAPGSKRSRREKEDSPDYVPQPNKKKRERTERYSSPMPRAEPAPRPPPRDPPEDAPEQVPIFCNDKRSAILLLARQRVICTCPECQNTAEGSVEFSCTQFEQHSGAGSAKKWKASLRIPPGGVPEVPMGGPSMPVGRWMEMIGMDGRPPGWAKREPGPPPEPTMTTRPARAQTLSRLRDSDLDLELSSSPSPQPSQQPERERRTVKKEERDGGMWEPWLEMSKGHFKPLKVRWAGDRCTVCDSDVDFDFDQLVSCDQCGITVHQTCYGVPELPGEDDLWLCRSCEFKEEGQEAPQCCLCPVSGGALKKTTEPGLWCHAACMQWIPEVTVEDLNRMEPVTHIRSIQKERWDLSCSVCRQKVGAKIQCSSCYTAYHPLCGRIAGLHMEMVDPEGPNEAVKLVSYCGKHCQAKPQLSGVRLISKEEESKQKAKGDDGNGLWNAQLFPPPALVPIPDCPSGSARTEALQSQGWARISHGTGMGHSSTAGYWIPKQLLQAPPQPRAHPPPKKRKASTAGRASGGRGRGSGRRVGRPPREAGQQAGEAAEPAGRRLEEVERVELEPLPEGVPEELPIQCNGRSALLLVRTQKVLYNDTEISASKFEALCGKGDAKKWKSSIWQEDEDGDAVMMMQDWLSTYKLDRKALAGMAANLAAVEAYEEWVGQEVRALLDEVVDDVAQGEGGAPLPSLQVEGDVPPTMQQAAQTMLQVPATQQDTPGESRADTDSAMETDTEAAIAPSEATEGVPDASPQLQDEATPAVDSGPHPSSSATQEVSQQSKGLQQSEAAAVGGRDGSLHEAQAEGPVLEVPAQAVTEVGQGHEGGAEPMDVDSAGGKPSEGQAEASVAGEEGGESQPQPQTTQGGSEAAPVTIAAGATAPSHVLRPSVAQTDGNKAASQTEPPEPSGSGPTAALGQHCEVYFPEDSEWYRAIVRGYDRANKMHNLWYYYDGEGEWIDLLEEDRSGRVRWDKPSICAKLRVSGSAEKRRPPPPIAKDALHGEPAPTGAAAVGWKVSVWWSDDARFYPGTVQDFNPESGRHKVLYDDGESEHLLLSVEHIRWDRRAPGHRSATPPTAAPAPSPAPTAAAPDHHHQQTQQQEAPTAPSEEPAATVEQGVGRGDAEMTSPAEPQAEAAPEEDKAAEAARLVRAAQAPDRVRVVCNHAMGIFLTQRGMLQMTNGQIVSPTEFERMAGKAASKKWKASIRIDKGNGAPGITIGDWLVDQGLDAPKAPRVRSGVGAIRHQQRQSMAMRSSVGVSGSGAAPTAVAAPIVMGSGGGKQGHRDSCMCVICKQSRRTGKPWSGMVGGPPMPVYMPAQTLAPQPLEPVAVNARFGKRAYVRCTGQLVRGPMRLQPWQVPKSRTYTPEEWEASMAAQEGQHKPLPLADASARPPADDKSQVAAEFVAETAPADRLEGESAPPVKPEEADSAPQIKVEGGVGLEAAPVKQEEAVKVRVERKALTLKERLEVCQATERQRLTFCKSGIHGWGLLARKEMKQDSMIIEYRGEALRRGMADLREQVYRGKDMDCYLFNINDTMVVDATMKGTIGRFTNHCCSPSMYTKVLEVDGQPHLVFFARQDIRIGQELTYDYRFKEEEGDNKLPCQCGAPNCRGFMN